jgi:Domain of unknown function (DUF6531)
MSQRENPWGRTFGSESFKNEKTKAKGNVNMINLKHIVLLNGLISLFLGAAQAQEIIIPANPGFASFNVISYDSSDNGYYVENAQTHDCGWSATNMAYRPFFTFDLSHYSGKIDSLNLVVSTSSGFGAYSSPQASESMRFYDVQLSGQALWDSLGAFNHVPLIGAYNDLGTGILLGEGLFSASTTAPFMVTMNCQNWTQLQSVRGVVLVGGDVYTATKTNNVPEYFRTEHYETRVSGNLTRINTVTPSFRRTPTNGIEVSCKFIQGTETGTRSVRQGISAWYQIIDPLTNAVVFDTTSFGLVVDTNGVLPGGVFNYNGNSSNLVVKAKHYDGLTVIADPVTLLVPPPIIPFDCCGNALTEGSKGISKDPIRYGTGDIVMYVDDIVTSGFAPWALRRSYSNVSSSADYSPFGKGWNVDSLPTASMFTSSYGVLIQLSASSAISYQFDPAVTPRVYTATGFNLETLSDVGSDLMFADTTGAKILFNGFATTIAENLRGKVKQTIDPAGNATGYSYNASTGLLSQIVRFGNLNGVGIQEAIDFVYDPTSRQITQATRTVTRNGVANIVRKATYQYYVGGAGDYGDPGQLSLVQIKDANNAVLSQYHYRYWRTGEVQSTGPAVGGLLKYVISTGAFDRMALALNPITPLTASNAQLDAYCEKYWEYDSQYRVVKQTVRGNEVDGTGTQTFQYSKFQNPDVFNNVTNKWRTKTIETLADGTQNIVYTNSSAQVLVKITKETVAPNRKWVDVYRYDALGREVWHVTPEGVVAGYDETVKQSDQLLDFGIVSSPGASLKGTGLTFIRDYYTSTNATPATTVAPGGVPGKLWRVSVRNGKSNAQKTVKEYTYLFRDSN